MRIWVAALISLTLAACASAPASHTERLFQDQLFAAPPERISADDVFALSDDMKRYVAEHVASPFSPKTKQRVLIEALYTKGQLKLAYDAELTRNAAQTFDARAGNCLSLTIMTAALAKEIGLFVQYQMVLGDTVWARSGGMYFSIEHVNLTLGATGGRTLDAHSAPLTIDFLPGDDLRGQRMRVVSEETIVAMFMNNRAAELLALGQIDAAYWWARAAIGQDPRFLSAYNTLGVIYRRHGNLHEAEVVLAHVLELEPGNTQAMANLVLVLNDQGRVAESAALSSKLEQLQPFPPFYYFERGLVAIQNGDYTAARMLFEKEVERDAYYHEFRAWLAAAYLGLGDTAKARAQLALAREYSTTRTERQLYAAKLDRIRSGRPPQPSESTF